ncbi:hypothetical protein AXG93_731s1270 [Marchantia polymorpha subsp. ruderalis]|uniref:Uncharacterized protein n=1 Tax=Marchantia polymorpha subsp. ruderalis TaxID=1480154 RepID=A0A176VNV2_MARPO|nr:hypothetical protein AXG93_731s1270 [Marchantia polymorpha subsp. ruderalis]
MATPDDNARRPAARKAGRVKAVQQGEGGHAAGERADTHRQTSEWLHQDHAKSFDVDSGNATAVVVVVVVARLLHAQEERERERERERGGGGGGEIRAVRGRVVVSTSDFDNAGFEIAAWLLARLTWSEEEGTPCAHRCRRRIARVPSSFAPARGLNAMVLGGGSVVDVGVGGSGDGHVGGRLPILEEHDRS